MKSSEAYLAELAAKNPRLFAAEKIQMTPEAFGEQIKAAFRAGARSISENVSGDMPEFMKEFFK